MIVKLWGDERTKLVLRSLLEAGLTYVTGAVVYSLQIPERFCPGRFDLLGHSHQIHHIFVVTASILHEKGMLMMLHLDCQGSETFCLTGGEADKFKY